MRKKIIDFLLYALMAIVGVGIILLLSWYYDGPGSM